VDVVGHERSDVLPGQRLQRAFRDVQIFADELELEDLHPRRRARLVAARSRVEVPTAIPLDEDRRFAVSEGHVEIERRHCLARSAHGCALGDVPGLVDEQDLERPARAIDLEEDLRSEAAAAACARRNCMPFGHCGLSTSQVSPSAMPAMCTQPYSVRCPSHRPLTHIGYERIGWIERKQYEAGPQSYQSTHSVPGSSVSSSVSVASEVRETFSFDRAEVSSGRASSGRCDVTLGARRGRRACGPPRRAPHSRTLSGRRRGSTSTARKSSESRISTRRCAGRRASWGRRPDRIFDPRACTWPRNRS